MVKPLLLLPGTSSPVNNIDNKNLLVYMNENAWLTHGIFKKNVSR
jgi:hypothetical protein